MKFLGRNSGRLATLGRHLSSRRTEPELGGIPVDWVRFLTESHNITGTAHGPRGQGSLLAHLCSVYADLRMVHKAEPHVLAAGLFHSIYGTEGFQGRVVSLSDRPSVQRLIGPSAEQLAFANCVMDRRSFDENVARCGSSATTDVLLETRPEFDSVEVVPGTIRMSRKVFLDLARVHLADWADLVASYNLWYYRRAEYAAVARLLGGTYEAEHQLVMATEPVGTTAANSDLPEMVVARQLGVFDRVQSGEVPYDVLHDLQKNKRGDTT